MQTYLNIVQIILGVALIILVLFEVRSSGMGFRLTVGTSVAFFLIAIINVLVVG